MVLNAGAVILAGGFGTRLKGLYPAVPKPMIEVAGLPFIEWVIRYLSGQGVEDICLSTGHLSHVVEEYISNRKDDGTRITSAWEGMPLGTAGGFLNCVNRLSDKDCFIVVNGDSLVLADLKPAFRLLEGGADAVIVGVKADDAGRYGSLDFDENKRLKGFREKEKGAGVINAGVYLFARKALGMFPEKTPLGLEHDVFSSLLDKKACIMVFETRAPFIDIGIPETVSMAGDFIREHIEFFEGGLR